MTVTADSLRGAFPEFASEQSYPDSQIDYYLSLGTKLQDVARWGNLFDDGLMLFVAHNIALEYQARKDAGNGNVPGMPQGPVTSGSVDKVSYSRQGTLDLEPSAGHWALTIYGLRYIRLVRMIGAGPVQVGVGAGICGPTISPWPGVINWPF